LFFGEDGYARRVLWSREFWGIYAAFYTRYLRGREGYHLVVTVVSEINVKVVKISTSSAHDNDF